MKINGWTLLYHPFFCDQMQELAEAARTAEERGDASNANVKLFDQILKLIEETIPADPGSEAFRQGNTLGQANRAWRRAKFGGRRFRLFFRYDTTSKLIVYAWVNDDKTLRKSGAKTDPYKVFKTMIDSGNPATELEELKDQSVRAWRMKRRR